MIVSFFGIFWGFFDVCEIWFIGGELGVCDEGEEFFVLWLFCDVEVFGGGNRLLEGVSVGK